MGEGKCAFYVLSIHLQWSLPHVYNQTSGESLNFNQSNHYSHSRLSSWFFSWILCVCIHARIYGFSTRFTNERKKWEFTWHFIKLWTDNILEASTLRFYGNEEAAFWSRVTVTYLCESNQYNQINQSRFTLYVCIGSFNTWDDLSWS